MSKPLTMPIRTQAENKVLLCARKVARMKAHATYIEHDAVCKVSYSDRDRYLKLFTEDLMYAADDLLNAMAIDEVDGRLVE